MSILDYYNQNPNLFTQNEHLLAKDPAYNLGMMDLGIMNFRDRPGGEIPRDTGWTGVISSTLHKLGVPKPNYRPLSRVLGSYNPTDEDISDGGEGAQSKQTNLFTGPFTENDTPTYWSDPKMTPPSLWQSEPLYNQDKARVMAHENRHMLTNKYPELYATQPTWTGIEEGFNRQPGSFSKMGNEFWRNETFNRFMDYQNYPDVPFEGQTRGWYPRGMSSRNLRPTDMYFDKIWSDNWKPHVKDYNKTLETISQNNNAVINTGGGGGRDSSQGNTQTGFGKSGMGRDPDDRMANGGRISFKNGGLASILYG